MQTVSTRRAEPVNLARITLTIALLVAGLLHLALAPEHFGESTLMGLGFLASGVMQIALAGLAAFKPILGMYRVAIGLSAALIVLYAINVAVGLPFSAHAADAAAAQADESHAAAAGHEEGTARDEGAGDAHVEGGWQIGAGEPVDLPGVVSKGAELIALGSAFVLLRRRL